MRGSPGLSASHAQRSRCIPRHGAWRQQRYGNVDWRAALLLGLGSIAGVAGGVELAKALPEDVLRRLFAVFMLAVAATLAWRAVRMKPAYPRADESA